MKRLAEIEKILMDTEEKIKKCCKLPENYIWKTIYKCQAYDKIYKLLFGDKK